MFFSDTEFFKHGKNDRNIDTAASPAHSSLTDKISKPDGNIIKIETDVYTGPVTRLPLLDNFESMLKVERTEENKTWFKDMECESNEYTRLK